MRDRRRSPSCLFQDIAVIPILAIMPLLALAPAVGHGAADKDHATTWVEGLPAWEQTLIVLAAVAAIVVGGKYLLRPVFPRDRADRPEGAVHARPRCC